MSLQLAIRARTRQPIRGNDWRSGAPGRCDAHAVFSIDDASICRPYTFFHSAAADALGGSTFNKAPSRVHTRASKQLSASTSSCSCSVSRKVYRVTAGYDSSRRSKPSSGATPKKCTALPTFPDCNMTMSPLHTLACQSQNKARTHTRTDRRARHFCPCANPPPSLLPQKTNTPSTRLSLFSTRCRGPVRTAISLSWPRKCRAPPRTGGVRGIGPYTPPLPAPSITVG